MRGSNKRGFTPHHFQNKKQRTPFRRVRNGAGFTILELVVVLAIFSILGLVIINVYLLSLRAQRQASYAQQTVSAARTILETIAQQVRTSEIDYSAYGGTIAGPQVNLALIKNTQALSYLLVNGQIEATLDGQSVPLTRTELFSVDELTFYINPPTDPFDEERCNDGNVLIGEPSGCQLGVTCTVNDSTNILTGFCICSSDSDCQTGICDPDEGLCVPVDQQPSVTMVLGVTSVGVLPEDRQTIFLQTTVVSRIYRR